MITPIFISRTIYRCARIPAIYSLTDVLVPQSNSLLTVTCPVSSVLCADCYIFLSILFVVMMPAFEDSPATEVIIVQLAIGTCL